MVTCQSSRRRCCRTAAALGARRGAPSVAGGPWGCVRWALVSDDDDELRKCVVAAAGVRMRANDTATPKVTKKKAREKVVAEEAAEGGSDEDDGASEGAKWSDESADEAGSDADDGAAPRVRPDKSTGSGETRTATRTRTPTRTTRERRRRTSPPRKRRRRRTRTRRARPQVRPAAWAQTTTTAAAPSRAAAQAQSEPRAAPARSSTAAPAHVLREEAAPGRVRGDDEDGARTRRAAPRRAGARAGRGRRAGRRRRGRRARRPRAKATRTRTTTTRARRGLGLMRDRVDGRRRRAAREHEKRRVGIGLVGEGAEGGRVVAQTVPFDEETRAQLCIKRDALSQALSTASKIKLDRRHLGRCDHAVSLPRARAQRSWSSQLSAGGGRLAEVQGRAEAGARPAERQQAHAAGLRERLDRVYALLEPAFRPSTRRAASASASLTTTTTAPRVTPSSRRALSAAWSRCGSAFQVASATGGCVFELWLSRGGEGAQGAPQEGR